MLIKTLAGISLFALAGGAIGYSQILCPDGNCSITGTPYGGAIFGSVLGLAVMSSITGTPAANASDTKPQPTGDEDTDRQA